MGNSNGDELKLTSKQIIFSNKYIEHGNGTRAAIEAGYSERSARAIASENLTKPNIKRAIKLKKEQILEELGITIEAVYAITWAIANRKEDSVLGYALKATQMLGKDLGIFVDRSELDVDIGIKSHEESLRELE